jgi:2-dehydro-3-deoxyphosphogluconate aldolase/(4S)-4-hydroxy-2-oxoglutarate aldolase
MQQLGLAGLLPVIKIDKIENALPLGKALLAGNLPVIEVTFRTDAAEGAIKALSKEYANTMLIGAGTILTTEQVDRAIGAGARYIVSPGFNPKIVDYCQKKGVPITPGINTPSEVEQAAAMGLKILKFFPAEQAGGLDMLKAFASVYGAIKFIPTGGISAKNLAAYAKTSNVHAVGGSWIATPELINAKNWDKISILAREAVSILHSFKLAHIGLNLNEEKPATDMANVLANLFDMKANDGNSSLFVASPEFGNMFELMKKPFLGQYGHIAIYCNNVERAEDYLKTKGISFNEATRGSDSNGTKSIYFADEIGNFAFHLVRV